VTSTPTTDAPTASGSSRRRPSRLVIAGIIGVVALFVIALVVGRTSSSAPKPPGANVGTQLDTALPADIANTPLVDETGRTTNLAAFKGKIVVLTDFMTLCQEV